MLTRAIALAFIHISTKKNREKKNQSLKHRNSTPTYKHSLVYNTYHAVFQKRFEIQGVTFVKQTLTISVHIIS